MSQYPLKKIAIYYGESKLNIEEEQKVLIGYKFLSQGISETYSSAKEFFVSILDKKPFTPLAKLGLLMANYKISNVKELKHHIIKEKNIQTYEEIIDYTDFEKANSVIQAIFDAVFLYYNEKSELEPVKEYLFLALSYDYSQRDEQIEKLFEILANNNLNYKKSLDIFALISNESSNISLKDINKAISIIIKKEIGLKFSTFLQTLILNKRFKNVDFFLKKLTKDLFEYKSVHWFIEVVELLKSQFESKEYNSYIGIAVDEISKVILKHNKIDEHFNHVFLTILRVFKKYNISFSTIKNLNEILDHWLLTVNQSLLDYKNNNDIIEIIEYFEDYLQKDHYFLAGEIQRKTGQFQSAKKINEYAENSLDSIDSEKMRSSLNWQAILINMRCSDISNIFEDLKNFSEFNLFQLLIHSSKEKNTRNKTINLSVFGDDEYFEIFPDIKYILLIFKNLVLINTNKIQEKSYTNFYQIASLIKESHKKIYDFLLMETVKKLQLTESYDIANIMLDDLLERYPDDYEIQWLKLKNNLKVSSDYELIKSGKKVFNQPLYLKLITDSSKNQERLDYFISIPKLQHTYKVNKYRIIISIVIILGLITFLLLSSQN